MMERIWIIQYDKNKFLNLKLFFLVGRRVHSQNVDYQARNQYFFYRYPMKWSNSSPDFVACLSIASLLVNLNLLSLFSGIEISFSYFRSVY